MNALTKAPQVTPAVETESAQLISMIGRLASDPNSDIDKMERLMAMQEKMREREARAEFNDALSAMQTQIPAIAARGKGHGSVTYAKWEDVNKVIKPIMAEYGFSLRFQVETADKITVTATLSRGRFEVQTSMTGGADTSGSKNAIQALGSSVSYLKRYTASALLNITSHDEDDDAYSTAIDFDTTPWTERILNAPDMPALKQIGAELKDTEMPHSARTLLQGDWAGRATAITKKAKSNV